MAAEEVADSVCLVVPCFNENARLHVDHIRLLVDDRRVSLVLVDDGSSDATLSLLRSIEHDVARVDVVALGSNRGKGEAVRAGLAAAMATGAHWVGYVDADMSTPPSEVHRLIDVAVASPHVDVVLGSRVALLGRDLRRSPFRHYTGRVFATLASLILAKPVYDTQCGAKLLRRTPALDQALSTPFRSRWAFDVELLGRLGRAGVPPTAFWEEPLLVWHDIAGSRRTVVASVRASLDLFSIWRDLR